MMFPFGNICVFCEVDLFKCTKSQNLPKPAKPSKPTKTLTLTHWNPYPLWWVGVWPGRGMGMLGKPQGYPRQSLVLGGRGLPIQSRPSCQWEETAWWHGRVRCGLLRSTVNTHSVILVTETEVGVSTQSHSVTYFFLGGVGTKSRPEFHNIFKRLDPSSLRVLLCVVNWILVLTNMCRREKITVVDSDWMWLYHIQVRLTADRRFHFPGFTVKWHWNPATSKRFRNLLNGPFEVWKNKLWEELGVFWAYAVCGFTMFYPCTGRDLMISGWPTV